MILARNLLQPLSGNKIIILFVLFLASCSPKIRPSKEEVATQQETEKIEAITKDINSNGPAKISLILPFNAKKATLSTASSLENATMSIDFYQGFLMAVNEVAEAGRNFQLQVLDSENLGKNLSSQTFSESVQQSDLIVGPVFPENIKQINVGEKYFVSPLAASEPSEFNKKRLISINPNIKLHADKISKFIKKTYSTENLKVVLLHQANSDQPFGEHLRHQFANTKFDFSEYLNINEFETKIQKGVKYIIFISASNRAVVAPIIDKLIALKRKYDISMDVFGHPNWLKQNYTLEKLQLLNVGLTTSFFINYKDLKVIDFIKKYRSKYNFEPGEYAFKGYDTGMYFAELIAKYGDNYFRHLDNFTFEGLHNKFKFIKDPAYGYMNIELNLVRYKNLQLYTVN